MEKIYGYKEKDVIGLAEFISKRNNQPLSKVFESYGILNQKAKGTVRNLYYALAKLSNRDKDFCKKYLNGQPIKIEPIIEFSKSDEKALIEKILTGKKEGRSVRSVVMELANGDGKLALRYQNKYRNAVKHNNKLITEIALEIKGDDNFLALNESVKKSEFFDEDITIDKSLIKIKKEIKQALSKFILKASAENQRLIEKIELLEDENLRLSRLLYGGDKSKAVLRMLKSKNSKSLPS